MRPLIKANGVSEFSSCGVLNSGIMDKAQKKLLRPPAQDRWWYRFTKWLVLTVIIGGICLVASIYQLFGGPPWPTEPTFTPQAPSAASPFNNPFDVANKSGLADIRDLRIKCRMVFVRASRLTVTRFFPGKLIFDARGTNPVLEAGSTRQFTCPFGEYLEGIGFGASALDYASEARIALFAEYSQPRWWPPAIFSPKRTTVEVFFTLDTKTTPPRWTDPLR